MPIKTKRKKLDWNVRSMTRAEKMAAGAADMEELLVETSEFLESIEWSDLCENNKLLAKIKARLKLTGRIP